MSNIEHSSPIVSPSSSPVAASGRVLIIDDYRQVRELLCVALESVGFQVESAASLAEASEWLLGPWPDVVVLDFLNAATRGLDAVHRLRARRALDGLPLLFLAGDPADGLRWRALQAGADCVIAKPLSMLELQERVSRLACAGRPRLRLIAGRREPHRLAG